MACYLVSSYVNHQSYVCNIHVDTIQHMRWRKQRFNLDTLIHTQTVLRRVQAVTDCAVTVKGTATADAILAQRWRALEYSTWEPKNTTIGITKCFKRKSHIRRGHERRCCSKVSTMNMKGSIGGANQINLGNMRVMYYFKIYLILVLRVWC